MADLKKLLTSRTGQATNIGPQSAETAPPRFTLRDDPTRDRRNPLNEKILFENLDVYMTGNKKT